MTKERHFLTEVLNPFLAIISYFKANIFTLKTILSSALAIFSFLALSAQNLSNIQFVENKGQWDSRMLYRGDVSNGAFFIRSGGITVSQMNPVDYNAVAEKIHGHSDAGRKNESITLRSHVYDVDFVGASLQTRIVADKPLDGVNNYYVGKDPTKWADNCRIFQAITIENIYPNIDARYYTDNGTLKYDIIVKPGGDVSKIALKYKGVNGLQVKNKQLAVSTSIGELKEGSPYTYQYTSVGRAEVNCKYEVKGDEVRFAIKNYDRSSVLIIDPSLIFCSYSGSRVDNWGFTATYGADGSMFGGGIAFGSGFPTTPGSHQTNFQGGQFDIAIIKLSSNGSALRYATYIGGDGKEQPHSLIADNAGNLVIAGRTNSSNYPLANPSGAASQIGSGGGYDIIVTRLGINGQLLASKRIGGSEDDGVNMQENRSRNVLQQNYGDDGRSEVNTDAAGNIYVASCTRSTNFPATAGSFQTSASGGQDGVLLKFNASLSSLLFASYLGGNGDDAAYVLSFAPNGDIYVGGGTTSGANTFPGNETGTINPNNRGGIDGFLAVVTNNGASVVRSTFLGTAGTDQVYGVQFDALGFPYVMGQTTGAWPVVNAAYSNAGSAQFIAKLRPDLSGFVYSTVFGTGSSTPNISPVALLVDRCENVYISGWGGSGYNESFSSSGTFGMPLTADAYQRGTDGKDFYFFVLKRNAESVLYATFFGELNNNPKYGLDHVDGGTSRFDRNGVIYQAVCANCFGSQSGTSFPTSPGVRFPSNLASASSSAAGCNLGMIKLSMNLSGVVSGVQSQIEGKIRDTAGCVPLTVIFRDTVARAQQYEWYFNYVPGNPPDDITTVAENTHTYTTIGTFPVMLVAVDPNSCNVRDSSLMNIKVGETQALPTFTARRVEPCENFEYEFVNTTIEPPLHPFKDTTFAWDFGDSTPITKTGKGTVRHRYRGPGTYKVRLILDDTTYCNSPDEEELDLEVVLNIRAGAEAPRIGCINEPVQFNNRSSGAETYLWEFGDAANSTSTLPNPQFTYTVPQTYTVKLTVFNAGSCNKQDDTTFTITILDSPEALATFSPEPPLVNTPTTFTNLSTNSVRYKWFFGDGDSLLTTTLQPVVHQYNATGTFDALLIAYNQAGCTDTFPMRPRAIIDPLLDVPNAFTPLTNDDNSIVMVRGFGIAKMQFIIWNRWGQKVFETNNRFQGWDGRVKGVVQPMDVYVYTLSVEYFDGTKTTKKGDITLIR
jgi:gliding motility-associated-like protein